MPSSGNSRTRYARRSTATYFLTCGLEQRFGLLWRGTGQLLRAVLAQALNRGRSIRLLHDDNNNQSTTIATPKPEHMAFGIGW